MRGGKKTKTNKLNQKGKSQPPPTGNFSHPARNLRKSDLGAVIFGCKNNTIDECYSQQLFGLPATHSAYVRNVDPGLVLFLFNYSDRTLHGIFEATSHGQMNINPYGWIEDGTAYTPYPAQVRVRIQKQCYSLTEDQFKPIIVDNYYEHRLFWFELDRDQTRKLVALFSSSPVNENASFSQSAVNWNTVPHSVPKHGTRRAADEIENWESEAGFRLSDQSSMQWTETKLLEASVGMEAEAGNPILNCQHSYSSIVSNMRGSHPERKWSALFKTPSASDTILEDKKIRTKPSKSILPPSYQSNMELETPGLAPCMDKVSNNSWEADGDEFPTLGSNYLETSAWTKAAESLPQRTVVDADDTRYEVEHSKSVVDSGLNLQNSDETKTDWDSSYYTSNSDREGQPSEASIEGDAKERHDDEMKEPLHLQPTHNSYSSSLRTETSTDENHEKNTSHLFLSAKTHLDERCSSAVDMVTEMKYSDIQSLVIKLVEEIEGLKGSQLKQIIKISSLEQELVESKEEIQQLKKRCNALESGPSTRINHVEVEYEPLHGSDSNIDESVLIVGGFDGSSWLLAMGSYSPSHDQMESLSPMTFVRQYTSAAKSNGELYIFGGVFGDHCYDTVEAYIPTSNQWVTRPSLNQHKGSLAGASLNDKLFAIGGGNGHEFFSEVEMFDPHIGKWMFTESMQQERLGPAAAEINSAVYVVGGYNGRNYLSSVERFDPRENLWTGVGSMSSNRGCHSLVVLNEKLYALGGYDGVQMVPTVEVFDPRVGSWMMGDPMSDSRGYSGAFTIGEKIYVMGGMKDNEEFLDTIECYTEGQGWEVTGLNGIGKRCHFSALVM